MSIQFFAGSRKGMYLMPLQELNSQQKKERDAVVSRIADAGKAYRRLGEKAAKSKNDDDKRQIENEQKEKIMQVVPDVPMLLHYYPGYDYPKKDLITLILDAYNQYMVGLLPDSEKDRYEVYNVAYLQDNRKKILEKALKGGEALLNMNRKFHYDDALTSKEGKRAQQRALVESYEPEIKELLAIYPNRDYPKYPKEDRVALDTLLRFYDYFQQHKDAGKASPVEGSVLSDIQSIAFTKEGMTQEENSGGETAKENVSPAQQKGLREIAMWMYRNSSDIGLIELAPSQERFVRVILNLPARMKLYMYYLIENKKRHDASMEDMIMSQTDYVPKLEPFKNQMIATKWKFWKRVDGSHVYWHKLEEALQIARAGAEELAFFGSMGSPDSVDRLNDEVHGMEALQLFENYQNIGEEGNIGELGRMRRAGMLTLLSLIQSHKKMLQDKEEGKKVDQKALDQSQAEILKIYGVLTGIDEKIERQRAEEGFAESGGNKAQTYLGAGGSGVGVGSALGSLKKPAEFIGLKLSDLHLSNLNFSAGIFSSLAGLAVLGGTIAGIINICDSAKGETAAETAGKAISIIKNFSDIAGKATIGAYKIINKDIVKGISEVTVGTAEHTALMTAQKASGAAAIVSGTIDVVGGMAQAGRSENQRAAALKARKAMGELQGEEKSAADEITELQGRISDSRTGSGTMKMVSGILQIMGGVLAVGGVTSAVGTILSGIATGINLAISVKEFFERRSNRKTTIDKYIKMDEIEALVRPKLEQQRGAAGVPEDLREQIRSEVIACLGFSSEETFYVHITRTYAKFLIERAFYKDGNPILADPKNPPKDNPYAEMIKSFGLKPIYPSKAGEAPKPDVDTLAKKMNI